ncbi:lysozyme g-like [Syngnathoides biaculeatus]|uniref:lysozyme g-like n=1 Tax=Syngnathoides biaculeatus TaxID=300417 RepID=UPI002ADE2585|nr:lysozyme g-like [Syngnathoides biaculeatus]XP_061686387.1 lysozyme g-like [Syngnathoides biaculeatus]
MLLWLVLLWFGFSRSVDPSQLPRISASSTAVPPVASSIYTTASSSAGSTARSTPGTTSGNIPCTGATDAAFDCPGDASETAGTVSTPGGTGEEEDNGCGDITKVDTTGASEKTARQDKLKIKGVAASDALARTDLARVDKYKDVIKRVGEQKGIDPAIIAGIISRESRAGNVLKDGWGDNGNGWGLMQVDKRYHTPRGEWDSEEHLCHGTDILIGSIKQIKKKFPNWTAEQQLKGGIAAYNIGVGGVKTYERMDVGTTGNDYSSDVVARAQWYKSQGGF